MDLDPPDRIQAVKRGVLLLIVASLSGVLGCAQSWFSYGGLHEHATMSDAYGNVVYLFGDVEPGEVPTIAVPEKLRPCCAFGSSLGVSVGNMPVLGFELDNILGPDDLGPHNYDNGLLSVGGSHAQELLVDEKNGLLYTCHGGFIDTAHLRDYADWMLFFTGWVARHLETGGEIELASEGGSRRVVLEPVPGWLIRRERVRALSLTIAEWIVFRLSVWHEIATWYGWSAIQLFPERASAFSPEDLYSNLLGIKVARSIIEVGGASSEDEYNRNVDRWMAEVLRRLGGLPSEAGVEIAKALDGHWWDSSKRLPDPRLVMRRNMDFSTELHPWRGIDSSSERARELLAEACADGQDPFVLGNPERIRDQRLSELARFEIDVDEELARLLLPRSGSRIITQDDFPALIERIRAESEAEFGPDSDRPG